MLSRDCDGCERQLFECKRRFSQVCLGEKVFCPDGTAHLVDASTVPQDADMRDNH